MIGEREPSGGRLDPPSATTARHGFCRSEVRRRRWAGFYTHSLRDRHAAARFYLDASLIESQTAHGLCDGAPEAASASLGPRRGALGGGARALIGHRGYKIIATDAVRDDAPRTSWCHAAVSAASAAREPRPTRAPSLMDDTPPTTRGHRVTLPDGFLTLPPSMTEALPVVARREGGGSGGRAPVVAARSAPPPLPADKRTAPPPPAAAASPNAARTAPPLPPPRSRPRACPSRATCP